MLSVGVTYSTYANIEEKIIIATERGGGLDIKNGDKVLIKLNLCDFKMPETGAVTHPIFLDALLCYLTDNYNDLDITVIESDATSAQPNLLIKWLGFKPILNKYGVSYCNLSESKKFNKLINGRHWKTLKIPKIIEDCDYLISLAKMKTHTHTKISCVLKNQFGCIPYRRKINYHKFLDDAIVDACLAMKPDFSFVDGILGLGGSWGPTMGIPIRLNTVVSGKDPVAVDALSSKIMGFNPKHIGHIKKAQESGLGNMSSKIVGEDIKNIDISFEYSKLMTSMIRFALFLQNKAISR